MADKKESKGRSIVKREPEHVVQATVRECTRMEVVDEKREQETWQHSCKDEEEDN